MQFRRDGGGETACFSVEECLQLLIMYPPIGQLIAPITHLPLHLARKMGPYFSDEMMIEDSSKQVVNLKVQGPEGLVDSVVDVLRTQVCAVPTGSKRNNDRGDGVHCYLLVTKGALEFLAGRFE